MIELGNSLDTRVAPVAYLEKHVHVGRVVADRSVQDHVVAAVGHCQAAVHVHQSQYFQGRVDVEEHAVAVRFRQLVLLAIVASLQTRLGNNNKILNIQNIYFYTNLINFRS